MEELRYELFGENACSAGGWYKVEGVYGLDSVADEIHGLAPSGLNRVYKMNRNVDSFGDVSYVKVSRDYRACDLIELSEGVFVTNKVVTVADMLEYRIHSWESTILYIFEDADEELLVDVWKELVRRGTEEGQRQFKRFAGMCGCGFVFD